MKQRITVTSTDFDRLTETLARWESWGVRSAELEEKIGGAVIMEREEIPSDIVTMNSKFVVKALATNDMESLPDGELTLVYPQHAAIDKGKISVLAPFGIALIGAKEGDVVGWKSKNGGERKVRIEKVLYQPEASGDWNL